MFNQKTSRRSVLKMGTMVLAAMAFPLTTTARAAESGPFELPSLPYPTDALQPVIGEQTMKLHHGKHHQSYVDKLNKAVANESTVADWPLEELLRNLDQVPESIRTAVRNNGGGHHNHSMFWETMTPPDKAKTTKPSDELGQALERDFGSLDNFKSTFNSAGEGLFGSGWVWLAYDPKAGKLAVRTTPNQDSLLMSGNDVPIFGNDVWEHAYYLDRQNRRGEYLKAWWEVLNWDVASQRFSKARKG